MSKLFGIPVGTLALVLVGLLLLALAAIAIGAARNRVFVRLALRNAQRRRARTALIVAGLMLGTTIVAAALATGDTMSRTIRSTALNALGQADEVVGAKGISSTFATATGGTGMRYFPQADAATIAKVGGARLAFVYPALVDSVAVVDLRSRQSEPRLTLYASTPTGLPRGALRPDEIVLNPKAADKLDAKPGDTLRLLAGGAAATVRVKEVTPYTGGAAAAGGLLMSLPAAQELFDRPGLVNSFLVGNRGGVDDSAAVIATLKPTLDRLGLEADNTRQDFLKLADQQGAAFMSLFTTFGSFSIAAGVLLIFLIFVMLAAERRSELGIARAVGTRRSHLVWMFIFEGLAYDLAAAVVGLLAGLGVAYLMVLALSGLLGSSDIEIGFGVRADSVVLAYAIGVLLTLLVVGYSARRVSRMNIVSAIRSLPEAQATSQRRRRRWLWPAFGILLGLVFVWAGVHASDAIALGVGVSVIVLSLVPLGSFAGLPDRPVRTAAGLALILWFTLPIPRLLLGQLKTNFSLFVLGGLMIVIGATWTIVYNADILLGALSATLGRVRALAPVLRMAIAYPLRGLFRTGVTLAMFTLVVFTLVVGSTITGSMVNAFNDVKSFGGGFDIRADASASTPIANIHEALRRVPDLDRSLRHVAAMSTLPVKAQQLGERAKPEDALVHGVDDAFLRTTTYGLSGRARGYGSAAEVWRALRTHPGLAVIDSSAVPRKLNYSFGAPQAFHLRGFYLEDGSFAPVRVHVRDPQTGRARTLTVIGVLAETAPQTMTGIFTSQAALASPFGARVRPTTYFIALRADVDPVATAKRVEAALLANGVQADAFSKLLHDAVSTSLTFDRLIEAFMALGLLVGVTALGVISARAVLERRQQIGVLRAIGFRRRMVQLSFLLEASFIALTAIVVGTGLGIAVAYNVVAEYARQPSMENLGLDVPWVTLAVIFAAVYAIAMLTTLAPARRASRVYPAEALRYQ